LRKTLLGGGESVVGAAHVTFSTDGKKDTYTCG
jgi:hypothetical protein